MAGFFGLFAKKNKTAAEDAYFLNADDAKTYGDIDYMRTSRTTRRTFPKTLTNKEGGELIQEVSSQKMAQKNPNDVIKQKTTFSDTTESNSSFSPQASRKTDTNMDMFRNMAKKIKK